MGTNHTFTVTATGDAPLGYQWSFASSALLGETNSTLQLTNIQPANAGNYFVVVSNNVGAVTSAIAILVVRATNDPVYAAPDGGWAYRYAGNAATSALNAALDGTWSRPTTSDSWSGDGRGAGNGLPGGVNTTNGILTIEDAVTSGTSGTDNRRFYFIHNLAQEGGVTNANTILNDGVTLTFRARITPPSPADPLTELTNAPNGYVNFNGGKGMFGIRQSGGSGMLISFSLNRVLEDINTTFNMNFGQAGLHMNSLNGNVSGPSVDPGSGVINLLPIESSEFHEFWITIQDNGSSPGTHRVSVYVDGVQSPTMFNVTAGTGNESPSTTTNYLAMGLPSTAQRGGYDIDFYGYKSGVILPTGYNDPVTISAQPNGQSVALGQTATFSVTVAGTPPFAYQWYRDGSAVANATNSTYTTEAVDSDDNGAAFVVVVSNICNVVTSSPPAILQILIPPTITTQPQSLTVTNGVPASFTVVASSTATLYYQWRFDGSNLANETNSTLAFSSVSPSHAGGYDVIVSNIAGSVTSTVATLVVRVFDFGDAPDSYATLRANNGARHLIVSGVRLGAAIDAEVDGQTNGLATADDLTSSDDEDGVTFSSPLQAGSVAIVEVVASTNGFLNGWMDFNGNGAWTEAGEQVFTNQALLPGTNLVNFVVPGAASATDSFARFRFGTSTNLSFNGPAADGEVEDYAVTITPLADLGVAMTESGDPVPVNSNIVYTITVTNAGPSTATAVLVDDNLPPSVTVVSFSSSQGSCARIGDTIRCTLGSLAPSSTATVSVTIASSVIATLTNSAVVSAAQVDPVLANNSITELTTVEVSPSISVQPVSLVVTQGNPASFSVSASGSAPLAYQWFLSGNPLSGETNATLSIAAAQPTHEGSYTVRITNRVGAVLSAPATLTVLVPPAITQQPASRTNAAGSQATFNVTATGSQPLNYQWRFNSAPLAGETNATLTLNNVQKSQTGDYTVTISNRAGMITSAVARLTVLELDFGDAPVPYPTLLADNGARHLLVAGLRLGASIDFEPDGLPNPTATGDDTNSVADEDGVTFSAPLLVGQTTTVAVVASTGGILNAWIDWAANGNWSNPGDHVYTNRLLTTGTNLLSLSIPATAAASNTFARFRFSSASNLTFVAEAADGEIEDHRITILALADLAVSVTDSPDPVAVGSNLVYSVAVTNSGPSAATSVILSNNVSGNITVISAIPSQGSCSNVSGTVTCALGTLAAGSTATLQLSVTPGQAQTVTNRVNVLAAETDLPSTNNSATATTLVQVYPVITSQPQSRTVTNGSTVVIAVNATGTALQYQWLKQGTNLAGEVNPSLVFSNVQSVHAGTYTVRVSNSVGVVMSDPAVLTVLVRPQITTQPQSQTVRRGDPFTLSVTATGTQPLAYQWFLNGVEVPGANSSVLSIANAQPEHEGTYTVLVSNSTGSEQSQPAIITLVSPPSISQQPQSRTNTARSTATFSVAASGTAPLSYRWFFNQTTPLANATNTTLTLTNVQLSQDGNYSVIVTNVSGAVTSILARLVVLETDFGDAPPIGYPTLLAFNGARHQVVAGIHLGARVDFEADGQPSTTAAGDDTETTDDEDGITFTSPLLIGQLATVQVVASTNGFLDAWIDFDRNGAWSDLPDQIFSSQPVSPGINLLSYQVPATALATNTFARFRFSTNGSLFSDGAANSGEVEDYAVTVLPVINISAVVTAVPEPVPVFSNLTYTIMVSNSGPSACSAARLFDPLPLNAQFVSVSSSRGSCTNNAGTIDCAFGTLGQGQTAMVSLVVRPMRAGFYTNQITVTAPEFDSDLANNIVETISTAIGTPAPFINGDNFVIPDPGIASPYPSTITVAGLTSMVYKVTVTLSNLSHNWPADLDVLLVGPSGQSVLLMSDAAAGERADNVTVKFDDDSPIAIPEAGRLVEATFRPTNYGSTNDLFPAPAPPGAYGSQLAVFTGTNPNGTWSLYVLDDEAQDSGNIAGGWHLQITTLHPISDVGVTVRAQPEPVAVESNLTYTVTVTNRGPTGTAGVVMSNLMPPNVTFVSAAASQGSCTNDSGLITCALGHLTVNASATITLVVRPERGGQLTNAFTVSGNEVDVVASNNTALIVSSVRVIVDLALGLTGAPEPAAFGQSLNYFLRLTNLGPNRAHGVVTSDPLPPGITFVAATASQGSCSNQSGTVVCNFGEMAAGSLATATITASVNVMGPFTNTASVTLDEIDLNLANNVASEITTGAAVFGPLDGPGLAIPTQGVAAPYPSTISVSGLTGEVYEVSVTLSNISHSFPDDLDVLLVGPEGQTALLVSDAGDGNVISNVTIILNDSFTASLPDSGTIVAGQFRPTQYDPASDAFPASAPAGPHGTNLAVFQRTDPNGIWSLYVFDDRQTNGGSIAAWHLTIVTLAPIADVSVAASAAPDPVGVGSNLVYTFTVTNRGPAPAIGVTLSNQIPASASFVSVASSQGACSNELGTVHCEVGGLAVGSIAQVTVTVMPNAAGTISNQVTVAGTIRDHRLTNNIAAIQTVVQNPPVIVQHPQSITVTNGGVAAFGVTSGGAEPFSFQWRHNGIDIPGQTNSTLVVSNAQLAQAGNYRVRVSNRVGAVLSDAATLTVLLRPTISTIGDQTTDEDVSIAPIGFIVEDHETPAAALVVTATSSDPVLVPESQITLSGDGTNRFIQILPGTNRFGTATIILTVRDSDGISATTSFGLLVRSVNDAPTISVIQDQTTEEDSPKQVSFSVDDLETAAAALVVSVSSSNSAIAPTNLMILDGSGNSRTLQFQSAPDQFGVTSIGLTVHDADSGAASTSFAVTIVPVNDPPTLDSLSAVIIDEDTPTEIPLTGITAGPSNEIQTLTITARSSNPAVMPDPVVTYTSANTTGKVALTFVTNATGAADVIVTVQDDSATNNIITRTLAVTVRAVNDAPQISTVSDIVIEEDSVATGVTVLVSDIDTPVEALTVTGSSSNTVLLANSNVIVTGSSSNRTLTLIPSTNEIGTSLVTLTVADGSGGAASNAFVFTVVPVNDPPTFNVPADLTVSEDSGLQTIALTGISSGFSNETQTIAITAASTNLDIITNLTVTYSSPDAAGTLTFGTVSNVSGVVSITITADDGAGSNNITVKTFAVTIEPVNDLPQILPPADQTIVEDSATALLPFTIGDMESAASALSVTAFSSDLTLVPDANIALSGTDSTRFVMVTPLPNQFGMVMITLRVADPENGLTETNFSVNVTPANDPPTISAIPTQITAEDTALTVPFMVGDADTVETLQLSATASDTGLLPPGSFVFDGSGTSRTVTITPASNNFGATTVTITVRDSENATAATSFYLAVNAVNDAPTISDIPNQATDENVTTALISFSVSDIETAAGSLQVSATSSDPVIVPSANILPGGSGSNRTVRVRPATNQTGTVSIRITVRDAQGAASSDSFDLTINPIDAAPGLASIPDQTMAEDQLLSVPIAVSDSGTSLDSLVLSATSSNQSLVPNAGLSFSGTGADRILTIVPAPNQSGVVTIAVAVADAGNTNSRNFELTIVPVNDRPSLDAISDVTLPEDFGTRAIALTGITAGAVDENQPLTVSVTSDPTGILADVAVSYNGGSPTGLVSFSSMSNLSGSVAITISLNDGGASNNVFSRTFNVTIEAVDDPPEILPVAAQATAEDVSLAVDVEVRDADTPVQNLVLSAVSSNQVLVPDANMQVHGSGQSRLLVISPAVDQFGNSDIRLSVSDGTSTASQTFRLDVRPVNDPPTLDSIADIAVTMGSGQRTIDLLGITAGAVNENQTLSIAATSSNPALIPDPTITYTNPATSALLRFTPAASAVGTALITVTIDDGETSNNITRRFFTVFVREAGNQSPTISSIADQTTPQNTPIVVLFQIDDLETAPDSLTLAASAQPSNLVSQFVFGGAGTNRTLQISPAADQSGTTLITISATDTGGAETTKSFLLTVTPPAPSLSLSAISDQTTFEDTPVTVPFALGHPQPDFSVLTATSSNTALLANTNILFSGSGSNRTITLVPSLNATGTTLITLSATNGTAGASRAFRLTVSAVNDPPTLNPLDDRVFDSGNQQMVDIPLSGITSGAANETQTLSITAASSAPTIVSLASVTYTSPATNGSVRIRVERLVTGIAVITVNVSDGQATNSRSFTVFVKIAGNASPTISAIPNQTIDEDSSTGEISFTIGDATTPAPLLTVTARSFNPGLLPNSNSNIVFGGTGTNRTVTITPLPNQSGTGVVRVTVTDTNFGMVYTNLTVTVRSVNDLPTAATLSDLTVSEDPGVISIPISVGDVETPASHLVLSASYQPSNLTSRIDFGGSGSARMILISPAPNQFGVANVNVNIQDADGGVTARTFNLSLAAVNDAPTLDRLNDLSVPRGSGPQTVLLTGISSGASNENQVLTVTAASSQPDAIPHPQITYNSPDATGTLTFAPTQNASGSATIMVTVSDGGASNSTVTQRFSITIGSGGGGLPTISDISDQTIVEDTTTGLLSFTIGDGETPVNSLTVTAGSSNPALVVPALDGAGSNRTVTLTPLPNMSGTATVTIAVSDSDFGFTSMDFLLIVSPTNDVPTISNIGNHTILEDTETPPLPVTIDDVETPAGSLVLSASSSNPTLIPDANIFLGGSGSNRTIVARPLPNQTGVATLTLRVSDGSTNAQIQFDLTVTATNDPPSISSIEDQITDEDVPLGPIPVAIDDIEPGTLILSVDSSNPELLPPANVIVEQASSLLATPVTNRFGETLITLTATDEGGASASISFLLTVRPINDPPTLDALNDITLNVGAGTQVVSLSGITSGDTNELQTLAVSAISSNPQLIPNPIVTYTSPATTGTLSFRPVAGLSGTATITVKVNDGQPTNNLVERTFTVTVNGPPVFGSIADVTTDEDVDAGPIAFTLTDPDTPADSLNVTVSSSYPSLIPNGSIVLSGAGTNRFLTITPTPNRHGFSIIRITASDPQGNSSSSSFALIVLPVNDPPTISEIPDQSIAVNGTAGPVGFSIYDLETTAAYLWLIASSSNPLLVPDANIILQGNGSGRSVTVQPLPDQQGTSTITISVTDTNGATTTETFLLTVNGSGTAPTIARQPADQSVLPGRTATFVVTASGNGPLTYQWRHNGIALPGATSPLLVINNAQDNHIGEYTVEVSNAHGAVGSVPARLAILVAATITDFSWSPAMATISFETLVDLEYTVQYTDSLSPPNWISLETIAGTGATVTITDLSPASSTRFYRIRAE